MFLGVPQESRAEETAQSRPGLDTEPELRPPQTYKKSSEVLSERFYLGGRSSA